MSSTNGDISVSIGLSEEDLNRGVARVAATLAELAKSVERVGQQIDKVMDRAAAETQKTAKATKELTEEEKQAAEAAKKAAEEKRKLTEEQKRAAKAAQEHKEALNNLRQGLTQIAAVAAVATAALVAVAKSGIDAFNEQERAFLGLEAVAGKLGESLSGVKNAAEELISDGLMPISDAATGLKNLMAAGFGLPEAIELMKAFKDAAAFGRQGSLSFGEAVKTATEGIKNGNSILVDNAGITKNLSVILTEAGYSAQDLMNVQSDVNVRMALYNGILKEADLFQGNAAKAADTLAGAQSRAGVEAFKAKAAFGEALAPAVQSAATAMGEVLSKVTVFIEQNPALTRTLFLMVTGIAAVTTAVSLLTVAVLSFNASMGPVGWAILGISAAAGALIGLAASTEATKRKQSELQSQTADLIRQYEALRSVVDDSTTSVEDKTRAEQKLKDTLDKLIEIQPQMRKWFDEEGRLLDTAAEKYDKLSEAVMKATRAQLALKEMEAERELADIDRQLASREQKNPEWTRSKLSPGDFVSNLFGAKTRSEIEEENLRQFELEGLRLDAQRATIVEDLERLRDKGTNFDRPLTKDELLPPSLSGGNGTGAKKDAYKDALRYVDHLKKTEQITAREEIAMLEEVERVHAATQEEKWDITERIHSARKALTDEELKDTKKANKERLDGSLRLLDHELRMNQVGATDEIARLRDILATHKMTDEERMALQERLQSVQERYGKESADKAKDLVDAQAKDAQERADNAVRQMDHELRMNQIVATDEITRLKEILATHTMTDEKRTALEERLHTAQQQFAKDAAAAWKDSLDTQAKDAQERVDNAIRLLNYQQRTGQITRAEEITALEEHLRTEQGYYEAHAQERWSIEERIYGLREEAREEDQKAQKKADDEAAREQESWLKRLARADLDRIRAGHEAEQRRQSERIKGLQDELSALERVWAAEDRRTKKADLVAELAAVKADTRFEKILPDGTRIFTFDEERARDLERQLRDADRDEVRAQQREALQDQIQAGQNELAALRTKHQTAEAERQSFWTTLMELDADGFADLATAAGAGLDAWTKVFKTKVGELRTQLELDMKAIQEALSSISMSGIGLPPIQVPTLPATLAGSISGGGSNVTVAPGAIQVTANLPNVTDAASFGPALPQAMAGVDLGGLIRSGRIGLRAY